MESNQGISDSEYVELGRGHLLAPDGTEYIRVRGVDPATQLTLWTRLVEFTDEGAVVEVTETPPPPDRVEIEVHKGTILLATRDPDREGGAFFFSGTPPSAS